MSDYFVRDNGPAKWRTMPTRQCPPPVNQHWKQATSRDRKALILMSGNSKELPTLGNNVGNNWGSESSYGKSVKIRKVKIPTTKPKTHAQRRLPSAVPYCHGDTINNFSYNNVRDNWDSKTPAIRKVTGMMTFAICFCYRRV